MKLKKLTPLAAIILMTLILLVIVRKSEEPLSVETILKYTPENMILAACVLVLFFALNSVYTIYSCDGKYGWTDDNHYDSLLDRKIQR